MMPSINRPSTLLATEAFAQLVSSPVYPESLSGAAALSPSVAAAPCARLRPLFMPGSFDHEGDA
jgi:hypothetical protein